MLGPSIRGSHSLKRMCCREAIMIRRVSGTAAPHPIPDWSDGDALRCGCDVGSAWCGSYRGQRSRSLEDHLEFDRTTICVWLAGNVERAILLCSDVALDWFTSIISSTWRAYTRCITYLFATLDSVVCCTGSDAGWPTRYQVWKFWILQIPAWDLPYTSC